MIKLNDSAINIILKIVGFKTNEEAVVYFKEQVKHLKGEFTKEESKVLDNEISKLRDNADENFIEALEPVYDILILEEIMANVNYDPLDCLPRVIDLDKLLNNFKLIDKQDIPKLSDYVNNYLTCLTKKETIELYNKVNVNECNPFIVSIILTKAKYLSSHLPDFNDKVNEFEKIVNNFNLNYAFKDDISDLKRYIA